MLHLALPRWHYNDQSDWFHVIPFQAGGRPDVQHGSSVMPCHTPLHVAARFGSIAVIKILLSVHRDPSPKDAHGLTPLHYAAFNG